MKVPLFTISVFFLVGVVFAAFISSANTFAAQALLLAILIAALYLKLRKKLQDADMLVLIAVMISGAVSFLSCNILPKDHVKYALTREPYRARLEGVIADNPVFSRKLSYFPELDYTVKARSVSAGGRTFPVSGLVLVNSFMADDKKLEYGDHVRVTGMISAPAKSSKSRGFNYASYLASKQIFAVLKAGEQDPAIVMSKSRGPAAGLKRALYAYKNSARDYILENLAMPHCAVLAGMLLNERQFFPRWLKQVFVNTGTMHIIAISGLHFTVIIFILLTALSFFRVSVKFSYIAAMVFVLLYALMIGDAASVWRSYVMAAAFMFAFLVERRAEIINVTGLALLALLVYKPNYIYDAGFILSFACVFSIIWILPATDRLLRLDIKTADYYRMNAPAKAMFYMAKSFSLSLAVWLGVWPIIAVMFKMISPITIVANIIAVPVSFLMLGAGLGAVLTKDILPFISGMLLEAFWFVDTSLILCLQRLETLPLACIRPENLPFFYIFLYYALLAVFARRCGRATIGRAIILL